MKNLLGAMALVVIGALGANGQESAVGDYTSLSIDHFGILKANFNGTLERLGNGVKITLKSDKPGVDSLPIEAGNMSFDWPAGAATPNAIIMEGDVRIQHPQATVRANKAEWNFAQGTLTFTGNPVMTSEMFKEMRGNAMILNFNTGQIEVTGEGRLAELPLRGGPGAPSAPASPNLLGQNDITNWAGLIEELKTQARAQAPSPGRQVMGQLPRQVQSALLNMPTADLAANPSDLLKQLNDVLRSRNLYSAEAWDGIALSAEAQTLLEKQDRGSEEQIRLNRLLLQAAYPSFIREV